MNDRADTADASSEPDSSRVAVHPLVMRLQRHYQQMAPHVKERKTAILLHEATDRIRALETALIMVKDNDIARFLRTGEFGNGRLVREEIQKVLGA